VTNEHTSFALRHCGLQVVGALPEEKTDMEFTLPVCVQVRRTHYLNVPFLLRLAEPGVPGPRMYTAQGH
jgi:hypothetical protein